MSSFQSRVDDSPSPNVTPPASTIQLPPSPPQSSQKTPIAGTDESDNILLSRFLKALNAEPVGGVGDTFQLAPGAYSAAAKDLEKNDVKTWGYVSNKLRHDLFEDKLLVLRMPSKLHENIGQELTDAIKEKLRVLKESCDSSTKQLINNIHSGGAGRVNSTETNWQEPDQQFRVDAWDSGMLIETAYTQSYKKLARKADAEICDSNGKVQLVIGLETDQKTGCVRISTWRQEITPEGDDDILTSKVTLDRAIIRDDNGTVLPGSLTLRLEDFAEREELEEHYPGADLSCELLFTYTELATFIVVAEKNERAAYVKQAKSRRRNLISRKRPLSPDESLSPADEREFRRREAKIRKMQDTLDGDY